MTLPLMLFKIKPMLLSYVPLKKNLFEILVFYRNASDCEIFEWLL